jgi:hypothetical protein
MQLQIDNPCSESWSAMKGSNKQRFCDHCQKDVFNLSEMTEIEAGGLLTGLKDPCVRFQPALDGSVLFKTAAVLAVSLLTACETEPSSCPANAAPVEIGMSPISPNGAPPDPANPTVFPEELETIIPEATLPAKPVLQGQAVVPEFIPPPEPIMVQGGISTMPQVQYPPATPDSFKMGRKISPDSL